MRRACVLLAGGVLAAGLFLNPAFAAPLQGVPPAARAAAGPNAAAIYWQAFAIMPTLGDEERQKVKAATGAASLPAAGELQPILTAFEPALRGMHRATAVPTCDWELDYEAGPFLLMPHLAKARDLANVALLRARVRLASGDTAGAVADVVAVSKMARACGTTPILISMLVGAAVEKQATDVLAMILPSLKPAQLDELATALRQLPPTASFADCLRGEARANGDWVAHLVERETAKINDSQAGGKVIATFLTQLGTEAEGGPKVDEVEAKRRREIYDTMTIAEVRESVRRMQADYAEMAAIAALGPAEQTKRWADFESRLADAIKLTKASDKTWYFSTLFLPQGSKAYDRDEQLHVRRRLMELAVQVQRRGAEAIEAAKAAGDGKIEYRKTEGGFELQAPLASPDKTLILSVGPKK